jgi:para-aminobenzoate synthetase/4-amino-4-deoxychorismate lyase
MSGTSTAPVRSALEFGDRPDPKAGIFETILIRDGTAPALDSHVARLSASAHELYGLHLHTRLAGEIALEARGHSGRLRVALPPDGTVSVGRAPLGAPPVYTEVAPFVLRGGLGPHKWADRALLDALAAAAGEHAVPLLIDADGAVLEASWASVLIAEGGRLISPPDDGRALPSIGRRRLRYDEEPVDLDRLLAADAVVLASALRVVRLDLLP